MTMTMTPKGIGVDIEEVDRFRKMPYQSNKKFYDKIFTAKEIRYCLSKSDPYQHFAARFAAKEAISKALNRSVYKVKEIEIRNNKDGVPFVYIKSCRQPKILISLSHTKNQAIAFAIWPN